MAGLSLFAAASVSAASSAPMETLPKAGGEVGNALQAPAQPSPRRTEGSQARSDALMSQEELAMRVRVELLRLVATPQSLSALVENIHGRDLNPQQMQIAQTVIRETMMMPGLPELLAASMQPFAREGMTAELAQIAAIHGIMQGQVKGLARMSPQRQLEFVNHTIQMSRSIDADACKRLVLGQVGAQEQAAMSRRYGATLPLDQFEAFLRLHLDALRAEVAGVPLPRSVTQEQMALAQDAFHERLRELLVARGALQTYMRTFANLAAASPEDACDGAMTTLEAKLLMPEPFRTWQVHVFVESMQ